MPTPYNDASGSYVSGWSSYFVNSLQQAATTITSAAATVQNGLGATLTGVTYAARTLVDIGEIVRVEAERFDVTPTALAARASTAATAALTQAASHTAGIGSKALEFLAHQSAQAGSALWAEVQVQAPVLGAALYSVSAKGLNLLYDKAADAGSAIWAEVQVQGPVLGEALRSGTEKTMSVLYDKAADVGSALWAEAQVQAPLLGAALVGNVRDGMDLLSGNKIAFDPNFNFAQEDGLQFSQMSDDLGGTAPVPTLPLPLPPQPTAPLPQPPQPTEPLPPQPIEDGDATVQDDGSDSHFSNFSGSDDAAAQPDLSHPFHDDAEWINFLGQSMIQTTFVYSEDDDALPVQHDGLDSDFSNVCSCDDASVQPDQSYALGVYKEGVGFVGMSMLSTIVVC